MATLCSSVGRIPVGLLSAMLLFALAAVSCTPTAKPPAGSPKPAETATTQPTIWWQAVLDRQSLLMAHATDDAKAAPPWVEPAGVDSFGAIDVAGAKRTYLLHVPPTYDGKMALPLVIALHGGGMDGTSMAFYSGISEVADREGFIVAYPDGAIRPAKNTWYAHLNTPADDVAFIRELIGKLESTYKIDRQHVMVAGGSAGALMAYRFALEAGDCINAIASFSGSFAWNMRNGEPPAMAKPVAPVSVLAVHGKLDKAVPYDGFDTDKARVWATTRSVQFWADYDRCTSRPSETPAPGVTRQTWAGGRGGAEVCLITLDAFGHNVPMRHSDAGPIKGGQVMWDFLSRDRACRLPTTRVFTGESVSIAPQPSGQLPAGAELRYTVDGSEPTASSPRVEGAIKLAANATVRVKAFVQGKAAEAEASAKYTRLPLRLAQPATKPAPGLRYAYYEGAWDSLPDVTKLEPTSTGVCAAPDLALSPHRAEDFVVTFSGFLRVPADGVYTLSTKSDDGSSLWLGGVRLVDNDGLHEPVEVSRNVALSAGLHAISIAYLQRGGDATLTVSIQGPGIAKRPVTAGDFVHE